MPLTTHLGSAAGTRQENTKMQHRMLTLIAMATLLAAAHAAALAPAVAAHRCASYDGDSCDPNGCREGEFHDHTHRRHWWEGDSEFCETEEKKDEDEGGDDAPKKCEYNGIEFPPRVCRILEEPAVAQ